MAVNRNRILKAADKYTRQGKLEAAVGELLKLLQDNPKDMTTINRVGDLYARLGKNKEAVAQFATIAESYTREGFLLKAIAIYKKITKLDPAGLRAYHALARLYSQQGLTMESRAQFQTVVEQQMREGAHAQALATCREMLELDPQDLKVRLTIAELMERAGEVGEALAAYQDVGQELDRRGMHAEARKVYEAALRLSPGDLGLVRRLILCLRRQDASAEALGFLAGLLEQRPDDPDLLSLVGDAHLDSGSPDHAREVYDQARKVAPDRLENRLNEARLALHGEDLDAAFEHLESVLHEGADPDRLIPYVLELLDARPHHAGALRSLVDLHEVAGQDGAARDACIRLAGACMEQGNLPDTAAALERLIKMDPENSRHQERLQDVVARIRQEGGTYPPEGQPAATAAGAGTAEEAILIEAPEAESTSEGPEAADAAPAEGGGGPGVGAPGGPSPALPEQLEAGVDMAADIEAALPQEEEAVDADFVAEHMTEAEVFVKYGLVDRAVEQLRLVLDRYPNFLTAHEALLGIHREEGDRAATATDYRNIARVHQARGASAEAEEALRQAAEFGPPDGEPLPEEALPLQAAAAGPETGTGSEPQPAAPETAGAGVLEDARAAMTPGATDEAEELDEGAEIDLDAVQEAEALPLEQLEDVDALIEGGALDEARRRLLQLRADFPDRSELEERLHRIGILEAAAQPLQRPEPHPDGESVDFFDLASELDESLFEAHLAVEEEPEAEGHSLEDLVEAFKKGVEQEVDSEDFETHYNLAIAYKEMGLVDEAIGEFQFAAKSPEFFLKCCSMLGFCFREKGMAALAVKWYSKGLDQGGGDEDELLGLRYDLAALLQESGEGQRAIELFTEIYGANAKYRDVAERLSALRESASGG